jgi:predicted Zn-ribbon and HTH transcriptional regulator
MQKNDTQEQGCYILIRGHRCHRCNHAWRPKNLEEAPIVCPKCKSPYWKKPKKAKSQLTQK